MTEYFARFPSTARSVARARRTVKNFARLCGFTGRALTDVEIAVGEAAANAVERAGSVPGSFTLRCGMSAQCLIIEIEDPPATLTLVEPPPERRPEAVETTRKVPEAVEAPPKARPEAVKTLSKGHPEPVEAPPKSDAANDERPRGYGALIMHKTMDSVTYENRGRRIRFVKRLPAATAAAAKAADDEKA